jgi:hypothetical protein
MGMGTIMNTAHLQVQKRPCTNGMRDPTSKENTPHGHIDEDGRDLNWLTPGVSNSRCAGTSLRSRGWGFLFEFLSFPYESISQEEVCATQLEELPNSPLHD